MTIDEIQDQLADNITLDTPQQDALWAAINDLEEPMRASMIAAFLQRYPE